MKQLNITFLLTMLMSMIGIQAFAHDIEVPNADGVTIYYNYINNSMELAVTYRGSSPSSYDNDYSGNVVVPETVTYNGKTYSVTSIGNTAFWGCKGLTEVTIPNSVTSIGSSAFSFCTGLTKVTIPNSVTSIGEFAFNGSTGLTEVTIGNSVTSIGNSAFNGCTGLTEVNFNATNCTKMGNSTYPVFKGCSSLTTINIGDNVETIPNYAFYGCSGLTSVTIGNSVTSIGSEAFSYCSGLTSVTIPNSVTSIGQRTFSGCLNLLSVTIPSSVTIINSNAFYECNRLKIVNYLGTLNQWLSMTFLDNPLHYRAALYLNGSSISNIIFANIDGTVGTQLRGCTNLKSVTIASNNTVIAEKAFEYCSMLEEITLPNSITTINNNAFYGCENLHTVYYNGTIADWYAMTLTDTPLSNGAELYLNNTLLTSVTIPSSVTTIASNLRGCSSLKTLYIPSNVTAIGQSAFSGCSSLSSVTIPSSVTTISAYAFSKCISLTSIDIPSSVTNFSEYAFYQCLALQNINFSGSDNYTTIDGVVYDKDVTRIITYPQGRTSETYTYPSTITDFSGIPNNPYLKRINVPQLSNTPSISYFTFNVGDNLEAVVFEDFVGEYYTKDGVVYKKAEYSGESENCLVFCPRGKTSLTVTPDVSSIIVDGFFSNSKLENLTIEASERYLSLFSNGSGNTSLSVFHSPLKNVSLGRNIVSSRYINLVFENNPSLETVVIGENMTSIPSYLFNNCSGLTNVTLPDNITSVGANAFTNTPWLASLPTFDGVKYYNNIALEYEYSEDTKDVWLKDGTSVLAGGLFKNSNVESVALPISVTNLCSSLFGGCSKLKKLVFPNSITTIPNSMGSGAVENFHVPGSVYWIGIYSINECDTVVIEDGSNDLRLQDRNADDGYWSGPFSGVKKLYIGRNTKSDGISYAGEVFRASNSSLTQLTDVTFGPQVTNAFTGYEFRGCDKVTSVTCLSKEPFPSPRFYQISQTAILKVPLGSKQNYESAIGWSSFKSIEEVTEVSITMTDNEMVYAGDFDLDFSNVDGLQAFVAGNYNEDASTITFNLVQTVPAGKGVILKGAKGTYTVPCTNVGTTLIGPLCGTISGKFIRSTLDNNVNFVFDKVEHVFKPVNSVYGYQLSRNEAYLSLPASSVSGNITPSYGDNRIEQSLEIVSIPEMSYGNGTYTLPATTVENQALTWISSNTSIATISGNILTIKKAGTTKVTATQEGDNTYKPFEKEFTLTINKAALTIKANDITMTEGDEIPELTVSYEGFKYNDNASSLTNQPTVSTTASSSSPVGTYPITVSGAASDNYSFTYINGTLTVVAREYGNPTANTLQLTNVEGYKGKQVELPISLNNQHDITAFQFDLYLPNGVSVAKKSNGKMMIETTERMEGTYSISSNTIDNFVRVTGYSAEGDGFTGNSGDILNITLDISDAVTDGDYTISIKDIVLSDVNNTEYHPANAEGTLTVKSYTLGDVDNSGAVNINDVVCIINHILNKPVSVFIEEAADVDGSGSININDVVTLINRFILMKTGAPALMESQAPQLAVADDNYLHLATIDIKPGETLEIPMLMTNANTVAAIQGNIKLPEGLTFVTKSNGRLDVKNNDSRAEDFTLSCGLQSDGSLTFAQYSADGFTYEGSEGTIFTFKIQAAEDVTPGTYNIVLSNVVLSIDGVGYEYPESTSTLNITGTDGISNIKGISEHETYHTLDGREVKNPGKGIYIVNGKKVMIK